jgi:hypothetical protein
MFHLLTGKDPQDNPLLILISPESEATAIIPQMTTRMEQIICRAVEYKPENRFLQPRRCQEPTITSGLSDWRRAAVYSDADALEERPSSRRQTPALHCESGDVAR